MSETEVRVAKTEALFREVNERIAETADRFDAEEATFVCECSDPECAERLTAPLEEYEQVRADATHFLLRPGHSEPRVERVIHTRPGYDVVEKFNETVARVVRSMNPRAEPA